MQDTVLGDIPYKTKESLLKSIRNKKVTEMQGLSNEITFKVGIKYMITFNAVSYTHLDVYKRQTCGRTTQ